MRHQRSLGLRFRNRRCAPRPLDDGLSCDDMGEPSRVDGDFGEWSLISSFGVPIADRARDFTLEDFRGRVLCRENREPGESCGDS
jgi:hypothetical protein